MVALFIKLMLAHLIGDFLLQPKKWVIHKEINKYKSKYLYAHILVHLFTLLLVLQFDSNYWFVIFIIVISHFIIDVIKLNLKPYINSLLLFLLDQIVHFFIITYAVYIYIPFKINWSLIYSTKSLLFLSCLIGLTKVSSVLIEKFINKFSSKKIRNKKSFTTAGPYIGMLERLFVFTFIIVDYWEGIGFLIAAKLFGDVLAKNRKFYQYVLIGTLLSFGLAIAFGIGYEYILSLIEK